MNNLLEFKSFYLSIVLPNLPSYYSHFNENNFDKNISELIAEFEKTYNLNPFESFDTNVITDFLKQKKEPFFTYSEAKGSGIPNTLLNTHYTNFLRYRNYTQFNNLQDFTDKLNSAFGNFCNTFQKKRIEFNGNSRVASNSQIFGVVRDDFWTINIGSEQELQYHIFKNKEVLGYGLGFNAQKSRNNLLAVQNVSKFVGSFIQNKNTVEKLLGDYNFFDTSLQNLINIKEGEFILYGKFFPYEIQNNSFILKEFDFLNIYYDLRYKQFSAYKEIYSHAINNPKPINQIIQQSNMVNLLKYKKQIILQGPPGTGKTREAKIIAKEMLDLSSTDNLQDHEQFKMIQFHPSYTYEDFVRGIVAKPNPDGEGILYEAENKTLGKFAKEALENYLNSKKDNKIVSKEIKVKELFDSFIEHINDEIEKQNDYFPLTDNVGLISSDDVQAFRYKGKNEGWLKNGNRMLHNDIIQAYFDGNKERQDLKKNKNISGLARQHASYFVRVLNMFQDFIKDEDLNTETEEIAEKPYILVIDEINRANLSSVLGELIYALEYRGEEVESMYEVDGSQKLILPPNLYIIGTMNTADRSVGHIDYAIRRRFAFVEVLPKNLKKEDNLATFDDVLFNEVKALFTTDEFQTRSNFLSNEFEPKDVALGHSYFIDKSDEGGNMNTRLEYEIKPILLEYVRDGVLKGEDIKKNIEELKPSL